MAEAGIGELQKAVDTLICIPNQNLFRVANEKTTFADAFSMADQVLYSGVACITDLMVKEGLINLDFADVRAIMREMGKAMMGTGEASGDKRAILAAEAAIANPLLDEVSMKGARGLLISITGGNDLTLYEVDEAASRIRQEVDEDANIILGATFDSNLDGIVRVSVVATGIDQPLGSKDIAVNEARIAEVAQKLRAQTAARQADISARMAAAPAEAPAAPVYEASAAQSFAPAPAPVHYAAPPPMPADVEIMPVAAPKASFVTPVPAPPCAEYQDGPFIPPAPVQSQRSQRMPQIEDLPMPVQNQIRAQRPDVPPARNARGHQAPHLARAPGILQHGAPGGAGGDRSGSRGGASRPARGPDAAAALCALGSSAARPATDRRPGRIWQTPTCAGSGTADLGPARAGIAAGTELRG